MMRRFDTNADRHAFDVELYLNGLDANAVRVELCANGINGGDPLRETMTCAQPRPDAGRPCVFHATVSATRPASAYTARVIPQRAGAAVPLESAHILWQR